MISETGSNTEDVNLSLIFFSIFMGKYIITTDCLQRGNIKYTGQYCKLFEMYKHIKIYCIYFNVLKVWMMITVSDFWDLILIILVMCFWQVKIMSCTKFKR